MAVDVEGAFEGEDVFLPGYVASLQCGVAVWAQVYFWFEAYCFCPAVVFRSFHNSILWEATATGMIC